MNKEEKSNHYLVWDEENKKYTYEPSERFKKAVEVDKNIQKVIDSFGGPEAFRKHHVEMMAKDFECTTDEYELTEKIVDKVFEYFHEFVEKEEKLTVEDILDFTSDLEWEIVDALKSNREK